jgi:hypothetical protein
MGNDIPTGKRFDPSILRSFAQDAQDAQYAQRMISTLRSFDFAQDAQGTVKKIRVRINTNQVNSVIKNGTLWVKRD